LKDTCENGEETSSKKDLNSEASESTRPSVTVTRIQGMSSVASLVELVGQTILLAPVETKMSQVLATAAKAFSLVTVQVTTNSNAVSIKASRMTL